MSLATTADTHRIAAPIGVLGPGLQAAPVVMRRFLIEQMFGSGGLVAEPDTSGPFQSVYTPPPPVDLIEALASHIEALSHDGLYGQALERVFDFVDDDMLGADPGKTDRLLDRLSGTELPTEVLLGILTATRPYRRNLRSHSRYVAFVERVLGDRYDPAKVEALLNGLRPPA